MQATIYNAAWWILTSDSDVVLSVITDILHNCEFTILNFVEHKFTPEGYTALWLLGESHVAIHTFPETSRSYLELSSCSERRSKQFALAINGVGVPVIPITSQVY